MTVRTTQSPLRSCRYGSTSAPSGRECRGATLFLSPDHAILFAGVLIPVRILLNGHSVAQEPRDAATYWHIELDQHDIIEAEGLPAESFLDTGQRSAFAGGSMQPLHADFAARVWEADACVPLKLVGPEVEAARDTLWRVWAGIRAAARSASACTWPAAARHNGAAAALRP